ncbi:MAG: CopG family transcriptional regulator [bacterium]
MNYLKRTNLYLPLQTIIQLKKEAKTEGISMSELVRRILRKHISTI